MSTAHQFDSPLLRKAILDMAFAGNTVHIGCAFSIVELVAVLHRNFLRFPDNNPDHPDRDYLVLSKGHGVMAQYACMHARGWLTDHDMAHYFANGTELKGLSDSRVRGLEVTSGSLGHGFSVGVGLAMGSKLKGSTQRTIVIVGDGEINEGPIWEGALFAAHHGLDRFITVVDENGFQAMGSTEEVLDLGSIKNKFASFGFDAINVDGHDEAALNEAYLWAWNTHNGKPKAIVARTVKGKGVSFMEHNNIWHYTRLNSETHTRAVQEVMGGAR